MPKAADKLTEMDFHIHAVWKFSSKETPDETAVVPIKKLPTPNLNGKILGCRVTFSNGSSHTAMLGNIDTENPRSTEHFLNISIWKDGKWFHLSRYFDPDYKKNGPAALSKFLGIKIQEIFPITYDLRKFSKGKRGALVGKIYANPREKLNQGDLIALAVP